MGAGVTPKQTLFSGPRGTIVDGFDVVNGAQWEIKFTRRGTVSATYQIRLQMYRAVRDGLSWDLTTNAPRVSSELDRIISKYNNLDWGGPRQGQIPRGAC